CNNINTNSKSKNFIRYHATCRKLLSANNDYSHSGLTAIWLECWLSSRHERCFAHYSSAFAVPSPPADDGRPMEKRRCGSSIRGSPTACRISGMGERAKRRSKRGLLFSHARRVRALCAINIHQALFASHCPFRGWTHC